MSARSRRPSTDSSPPERVVLAVFADPDRRDTVAEELNRPDTEVATATDADEALAVCRDGDADAVVSDRVLPDGTGIELLRAVRAEIPEAPFFIYGDAPNADEVDEAYDANVTAVVDASSEHGLRKLSRELERRLGDDEPVEASKPQFESVAQTTSDVILTIDRESVVRYANPATEEVLGYASAELIGRPLETVMSDDLAEAHAAGVRRYLREGSKELDWENVEFPIRHADGREVPMSISFTEFEHRGERYFTGIARDITERKNLEANRHRAVERITDGFFALDTDWNFTYVNDHAAGLLERPADELIGESVWEEFSEAVGTTFQSSYERALAEQEPIEFTEFYPPLDAWFQVNAYPSETGLSVYFDDVTDRVESERELQSRVRQQEAGAELGRLALETEDVDELMREAARRVADALDNDYCKVLDLDADARELTLRQGTGWDDGIVGSAAVATDENSQAGYTLLSEEPVIVDDLAAEERFSGPELLTSHDVTSGISVVIGPHDDPWGILGTHDTEAKSFNEHDVAFVQNVATLLWTAIERRRLEEENRYERDLNRQIVETSPTGIAVMNSGREIVQINDQAASILRLTDEEIERHPDVDLDYDLFDEESDPIPRDEHTLTRVLERGEAVIDRLTKLRYSDGEVRYLSVQAAPFLLESERHAVVTFEDVTEQHRRERALTDLTTLVQEMAVAETVAETAELAHAAATDVDLPGAAVLLYDDDAGRLEVTAGADRDEIDDRVVGTPGSDLAWDVFSSGTPIVTGDVGRLSGDGSEGATSALIYPLGRHGVLLSTAETGDYYDETAQRVANLLATNARSALNRAEREASLRAQRNELERQNRTLERLERINRLTRDVTQTLARASTQDEIERSICTHLTNAEPYAFAWVGHYHAGRSDVVPSAASDRYRDYLDDVEITVDDGELGRGPTATAVRTEEVAIADDLRTDPPFEPWRDAALKRGFRSSAAVPLAYEGTVFGVLNIYASEPNAFSDSEREVLAELGETIGYAINALNRKQALVGEQSVELRYAVGATPLGVLGFESEFGREFALENVVQREDGRLCVFFAVDGADASAAAEAGERSYDVDELSLVTENDGTALFECRLRPSSLFERLLDRGVIVHDLEEREGGASVAVRTPLDVETRDVTGLFDDACGDVSLTRRKRVDEPAMTRQEFRSAFVDRLTERQLEVLRTAYHSGFFEWPRETSGKELADLLDVSQPTVNRHVRVGERKLFSLLFEPENHPP